MTFSLRRAAGVVAATALAAGLLVGSAPAAQAATGGGSIVFIKNFNIWIADGDGVYQRQITTDGSAASPWRSPTQALDGTVAAAKGELIYRMNQWGTVYNTIDTPPLYNAQGYLVSDPPDKVAISPDGATIAYTLDSITNGPYGGFMRRQTTAFTASTGLTDPNRLGMTYNDNPSWVTNSRVLVEGDIEMIRMFDLGQGEFYWFDEDDITSSDQDIFNPVMSPDGSMVAVVRGYNEGSSIAWYATSGNVINGGRPPTPTFICMTSFGLGFADPTFSADSNVVAWAEPDGIWSKESPKDCADGTPKQPKLIIGGGSEPDWSAAAIQTTRPPETTTGQQQTPAAAKAFAVKKKPVVHGAKRGVATVGKKLKAYRGTWSAKPSSFTYQWLRDGKAIKKATKSTYTVVKKDRGHRISVKITLKKSGYAPRVVKTKAVKIKK